MLSRELGVGLDWTAKASPRDRFDARGFAGGQVFGVCDRGDGLNDCRGAGARGVRPSPGRGHGYKRSQRAVISAAFTALPG